MDFEDMDLELSNYEYNDILKLFNLDINFNNSDLKNAKNIVYAVHPDKCKLDPKFFVFFLDAYKLLVEVAKHRFKAENKSNNMQLNFDLIKNDFFDKNEENLAKKFTSSKKFNKQFNELFDKYHKNTMNDGHGDWFKSDSDLSNDYDKIKQYSRALSINNTIETFSFNGKLGSDLNSSNNYGMSDLKNVYTVDTVLGVSEDDFNNIKKYNSVDELNRERSVNINPLDNNQSLKELNSIKRNDDIDNDKRFFKLITEEQNNAKQNSKFWANLKQLGN